MKVIKNYQKFMLKEGVELPMTSELPAMEQQPAMDTPVAHSAGDMTLYRLTSHPVVDLSAPGEFYVKSMEDLNPDFLENKEGDQLFVITVTCPSSNVNDDQSEVECAKHNCDCIVAVNNDSECEIVDVKPFNK